MRRRTNALPEDHIPATREPSAIGSNVLEPVNLWRTPLVFFGRIVDEHGAPISGVQVAYGANSLNETLTKEVYNTGTVQSDARGRFKIDGVRGIGAMLSLTHPDYYPDHSNTTGFDIRSPSRDGTVPDREQNAVVFRMHRKGNPTALIVRKGGFHSVPDGTATTFPVRGRTQAEILGQLQVQGWKEGPDAQGRYNWRVRITVPNGGILESTNAFAFVAPDTGYQEAFEATVPHDDPNWKTSMRKTIFCKLPGSFLRGQVHVDVYHDLFFAMDYFVNPDGSRNLELDPNLMIRPTQ